MLKQYRVQILAGVAVLVAVAAYLVGDASIGDTASAIVNSVTNVLG
jgi:hypothetical protein